MVKYIYGNKLGKLDKDFTQIENFDKSVAIKLNISIIL